MSETPHRCPVCNGTGLVSHPPHIAGDVQTWTDSNAGPYQCTVCCGSGIIWRGVSDEITAAELHERLWLALSPYVRPTVTVLWRRRTRPRREP
jgi:hypothetical protein